MVESESKGFQRLITVWGFQFTLPNSDAMPTHLGKLLLLLLVAFFVTVDFLCPKIHVGLWHAEIFANLVPMPKASVDKDAGAVLAKHKVRMTRQPRIVQPITKALFPQVFAHKNLWLRVRRANRDHIMVTLLWC